MVIVKLSECTGTGCAMMPLNSPGGSTTEGRGVTPFVSSFFLLISVRLRVVDSTYLASGYPSGFERTCAFISCALFDSQKFGGNENIDLRRDALHSARCLSVRVSVRPSHAGILSKRLNISCNFFFTIG